MDGIPEHQREQEEMGGQVRCSPGRMRRVKGLEDSGCGRRSSRHPHNRSPTGREKGKWKETFLKSKKKNQEFHRLRKRCSQLKRAHRGPSWIDENYRAK